MIGGNKVCRAGVRSVGNLELFRWQLQVRDCLLPRSALSAPAVLACDENFGLERRAPLQMSGAPIPPPRHGQTSSDGGEETRCVEATVYALIPEYHQVRVRDSEGRSYALTRKTRGVDLSSLREGQRVVCTVTVHLPRVVSATAIT